MNLYFEKFTLWDFLIFLIKKKINRSDSERFHSCFYIDISLVAEYVLLIFSKIHNHNIVKLNFKMMDIRDETGEIVRLRIARKDLFEIKKSIVDSAAYKKTIDTTLIEDDVKNYINKGLMDCAEMVDSSVRRMTFIIEVVSWHMQLSRTEKAIFVAKKRAWQGTYIDLANQKNIQLIFQTTSLKSYLDEFNLFNRLKTFPKIYLLLKNIQSRKLQPFQRNQKQTDKYTLFIEGRGDVNLENDGTNSDFFWQMNSDFPKENILYQYHTKEEKENLLRYGVIPVVDSSDLKDLFISKDKYIRVNQVSVYKDEYKEIKKLINTYRSSHYFWSSFFRKNKTRIFFTWYKYDNNHMVVGDAIKSLGGISAIWQMAFDGFCSFENEINADVIFSHSNFSVGIDAQVDSKYLYNVISGYPKDYAKKFLQKKADELRRKLQAKGAKNILCVLDENSVDDSRWHTGHELQAENYSYILEELLNNEELGVIFKPKAAKTLRHRIGDTEKLLSLAEKTGRCFIFEDAGRFTTSAPPLLAALASDICIHGHLCAGTAAVESVLAGIPTLLVNREGVSVSKLNELPRGKVIFNDWTETIEALREYFASRKKITGFGDWSLIKNDLDPFNDGLGAYRMGMYLDSILKGFERGLNRDDAMFNASEIYAKKWGSDKIIEG